jgi:hypothetical protein
MKKIVSSLHKIASDLEKNALDYNEYKKKKIASKADAADIFDEFVKNIMEPYKKNFVAHYNQSWNKSKETESSLKEKAKLILERMDEGRDFNDVCDDKDIYLGSIDSQFVYHKYILKSWKGSLEDWKDKEMRLDARRFFVDLNLIKW